MMRIAAPNSTQTKTVVFCDVIAHSWQTDTNIPDKPTASSTPSAMMMVVEGSSIMLICTEVYGVTSL
jgi:hypothetical protein